MMKHGVEGNPDDFTLSQLLPDKGTAAIYMHHKRFMQRKTLDARLDEELTFPYISELQIPPKANVYYAINTQHDLNFVLKRKASSQEGVGDLSKGLASTPGRKRDTSKARRKLLGLAL